ncbi:MAG: hypothetical protein K6G33_06475 [Ruminococcus sp.]|uniref:hypothetical protein n=1 Tax=Ruminococcus sp. TaxID=41978 RepID=UPI0025E75A4E|nr:hypothetical protein [Ruminococcus sp.]MCR5600363.1 hypothetical protein [Ruminococcus sp.]
MLFEETMTAPEKCKHYSLSGKQMILFAASGGSKFGKALFVGQRSGIAEKTDTCRYDEKA